MNIIHLNIFTSAPNFLSNLLPCNIFFRFTLRLKTLQFSYWQPFFLCLQSEPKHWHQTSKLVPSLLTNSSENARPTDQILSLQLYDEDYYFIISLSIIFSIDDCHYHHFNNNILDCNWFSMGLFVTIGVHSYGCSIISSNCRYHGLLQVPNHNALLLDTWNNDIHMIWMSIIFPFMAFLMFPTAFRTCGEPFCFWNLV